MTATNREASQNPRIVERVLAGAFALGVIWFFLPLASIVTLRLPPYAFGHEPAGVRFFQAWVPLHYPGHYPFVMVGYLLDLIHRGLLFILIGVGYGPERDLTRSMTLFADLSLLMHVLLMVLLSAIALYRRALPVAYRVLLLITGMSLGYAFYWGPLQLFRPDYPLSLIVAAFMFAVFAARHLSPLADGPDTVPVPPVEAGRHGVSIALVAAVFLLLKPSLLPYAVLAFACGVVSSRGRLAWRGFWVAAGTTLGLVAAVWFLLQGPSLYNAVTSVVELGLALATTTPVEPFRLGDLVTPGTIYFVPLLGSLVWLGIAVLTLAFPKDRRFRLIPSIVLAGGLFYVYVFMRRTGNATTFEMLIYFLTTGTVCIMVLRHSIRSTVLLVWCALLVSHTYAVARSTLPSVIGGARLAAEVAQEVDQYARGFGLPILYVYPDSGPARYDVFQSAESAVFKGTAYHSFVETLRSSEYQNRILSTVLRPYQMSGDAEPLPTSGPYVLVFADVPNAPSITQGSMGQHALGRATRCREWEQSRHKIHVCVIPGRS